MRGQVEVQRVIPSLRELYSKVRPSYAAKPSRSFTMADPLSITASIFTIVAAIQSTRSLTETVKRFRDRDKTLRRLHDELEDLINILSALKEICQSEASTLALLQGPVSRCSQLCREFENSMKEFSGKSKTGLRDWAKMEFMRGDINEFMDTLTGYKSTISIGLGTITMSVVPPVRWDLANLLLTGIPPSFPTKSLRSIMR